MNVDAINAMPPDALRPALARCCESRRWIDSMIADRPFANAGQLLTAAERNWRALGRTDWLEAFAGHPRIGDLDSIRKRFGATADLCHGEQSGVADAGESVIRALADGNREYEERFGYIFIVCATGKSAAEMFAILRSRLGNDADRELAIAADEQWKIMRLRLEKLCTT